MNNIGGLLFFSFSADYICRLIIEKHNEELGNFFK